MPDRDPTLAGLDLWASQADVPGEMPAILARRLRRRRVARRAPAALSGVALLIALAASLWLGAPQDSPPAVRPWVPQRPIAAAADPEFPPLTPVRWSPAARLRAGSCREPACVESWLAAQ